MTDPIVQAQNELNLASNGLEAAQDHAWKFPTKDNWAVVEKQTTIVAELRKRYNDLCIAYDNSQ